MSPARMSLSLPGEMVEAFLDRWANFLWLFVTPRRVRRCVFAGTTTAVIAFIAGWALIPPQPRWVWRYNSYRQVLVGFSPGAGGLPSLAIEATSSSMKSFGSRI